jgi:hypothetical protein
MMTTTCPTNTTNATGPRRGDAMPNGGRFVGKARNSSTWVSYEGEADFWQMAADFDRIYRVSPRRRAAAA